MRFEIGCIAVAVCFTATSAAAQSSTNTRAPEFVSEVRAGVFAHDTGIFSSNEEGGTSLNGEILFKSPDFLRYIGRPRPHIGGTWAVQDNTTSQAYFGLTWEGDFWQDRLFVYGSLGGAVHTGFTGLEVDAPPNRKALGCRVLIRESLGLGVNITEQINVAAHIDHISNATLCDQNEGLESAGLRFGYRF